MHNLQRRMHARVGTARSDDANGLGGNVGKRRFQRVLDGRLLDLTLPSAEGRAAVFKAQRLALSFALGCIRHY